MANGDQGGHASAGHRIGQLVGDWFEERFVLPMLEEVATRLRLFLDHRFRARQVRGDRILWRDEDGNAVDYDFVLELGGTEESLGIPVAFFESFWRRGKRHSKDKARDDSGKLVPMRRVHPTARFLGIIAGGDFTAPARQLIRTLEIDLFLVVKDKIVAAFAAEGLVVDYPDRASEEEKRRLAERLQQDFNDEKAGRVAQQLRGLVGNATISGYVSRVHAALAALPQELRFIASHSSAPHVFEQIDDATAFLQAPQFTFNEPVESYTYQITYSDGTEFERDVGTIELLRSLHGQICVLADHIASLQH